MGSKKDKKVVFVDGVPSRQASKKANKFHFKKAKKQEEMFTSKGACLKEVPKGFPMPPEKKRLNDLKVLTMPEQPKKKGKGKVWKIGTGIVASMMLMGSAGAALLAIYNDQPLTEIIENVTKYVEDTDALIAEHEATIGQLEVDKVALNETIAEHEATIAEHEATIQENLAEIERLEGLVASGEMGNEEAQALIAQLQEEIAGLEATVAEKQATIDSLNATIAEKDALIAELQAEIETLQARVEEQQGQIDELVNEINRANTVTNETKNTVNEILGIAENPDTNFDSGDPETAGAGQPAQPNEEGSEGTDESGTVIPDQQEPDNGGEEEGGDEITIVEEKTLATTSSGKYSYLCDGYTYTMNASSGAFNIANTAKDKVYKYGSYKDGDVVKLVKYSDGKQVILFNDEVYYEF